MTRAEPAERAEPVVPGDQGVRADPVAQGGPEEARVEGRAAPVEARAVPVDLVVPEDQVAPEDLVVPEDLEDRVVVDPAALVEVQVDPEATSNAAVSAGRL